MSSKNYQYSLDLLERINCFVSSDPFFIQKMFFEEYNIWYFFQSSLFSDIKAYSAKKVTPRETHLGAKGFVVSLIILFYSLCSIVFFALAHRRVLIFSVDSLSSKYKADYRMESLYQFLISKHITFFEIFHAIPGKEVLGRILNRARPAIYLKSIDFLFFLVSKIAKPFSAKKASPQSQVLPPSLFTEEEKPFVNYCVNKYVNTVPLSIFNIRLLRKILNLLKPSAVLLIDDARHYNELIVATHKAGIPSLAFQHGHYTKYHTGWLRHDIPGEPAFPDVLCVWSEYWKKELYRLNSVFPQSSIYVTGTLLNTAQDKPNKIKSTRVGQKNLLSILIPYETDAPKKEVKFFIDKLASHKDIRIIFKIRPNRDEQSQLKEYGIENMNIQIARNLSEVIGMVDVVGGVYSTILYDMVVLEKPVFIMKTSMDYGEGMVKNGLADTLTIHEIETKIYEIAATPGYELLKRREKILGKYPPNFNIALETLFKRYNLL